MIEYLRGTLLKKDGGHVVVDVGGVGYGVDVTLPTLAGLPEVGQSAELHTYFHVAEQLMRLYGFGSEAERDVFEVLISTSGIGPKTAIGILSAIEIGDFARAVLRNELSTLMRIPGVGKKTAERLVVELRDKMKSFAATVGEVGPRPDARDGIPAPSGPLATAIAGLVALGCKPVVAERAIQRATEVLGPEASTEDLVREGLKHRN